MLDNKKISEFISNKRKELGMTQAEVAEKLKISFQAVSKWENGTLPNVEVLAALAKVLHTTVDEILAGREKNNETFSYSKAGVDISYTDVRLLMEKMPQIKLDKINGETFIEQIMKPHTSYYKSIKSLFSDSSIHGMAHITGGGIEGNLCRIIPDGLCAEIHLDQLKPLPIFSYIKAVGNIDETEMLSTFNCGAGMITVVERQHVKRVEDHIKKYYDCYEIGEIETGSRKVSFKNHIAW